MKSLRILPPLAALVLGLLAMPVRAHDDARKSAGPNGGRVIGVSTPPAEFFVTPDRKVRITFLGPDGKSIAPAGQVVTVTAGSRLNPTTLKFVPDGAGLLSDVALPAGSKVPAVVQIKPSPDAKAVVARFNVNLSVCPECKHAEYACICGH